VSADGATVYALAGRDGMYGDDSSFFSSGGMHLTSGLTWQIDAVSGGAASFCGVKRKLEIEPTSASEAVQIADLVLEPVETMMESHEFTFESSKRHRFDLSDGSWIMVPRGAFAEG